MHTHRYYTTMTWKVLISPFMEHVNTRPLFSYKQTPIEFSSVDKLNNVKKFKLKRIPFFRCRCHRGCLEAGSYEHFSIFTFNSSL